jgi:hypothetical protein
LLSLSGIETGVELLQIALYSPKNSDVGVGCTAIESIEDASDVVGDLIMKVRWEKPGIALGYIDLYILSH